MKSIHLIRHAALVGIFSASTVANAGGLGIGLGHSLGGGIGIGGGGGSGVGSFGTAGAVGGNAGLGAVHGAGLSAAGQGALGGRARTDAGMARQISELPDAGSALDHVTSRTGDLTRDNQQRRADVGAAARGELSGAVEHGVNIAGGMQNSNASEGRAGHEMRAVAPFSGRLAGEGVADAPTTSVNSGQRHLSNLSHAVTANQSASTDSSIEVSHTSN